MARIVSGGGSDGITPFGSSLGNALTELLTSEDILPGDTPSYELCKKIWVYHPLGKKMVEAPIELAQSQARNIAVPGPAEDRVSKAFVDEWNRVDSDGIIANVASTARAYGVASLGLMVEGLRPGDAIDWKKLPDLSISFSIFDPLNTAGSIVLNQDPLAMDFQKITAVAVSGQTFHRSRIVTLMHEKPIYIEYTTSAYGFVGRSVFQRALFPLKSYVQSMMTDDLITKKAGVFIAMLSTAGAIINSVMQMAAGIKRLFIQQSTNGNVISIGKDEKIETLNMQNIDGAYGLARTNILDNIAISADMPAIILKEETFVEGFGEGTEDAKKVARWIDRVRRQMGVVYRFMDNIVQRRAWTQEFFEALQNDFPEYSEMTFEAAFYQWTNRFTAEWPNLLTEPDSEKVKTDDVKHKAIIATIEVLGPILDPENKATLVAWAMDNFNENKLMFPTPLVLDIQALAEYEPPQPEIGEAGGQPKPPRPFHDSSSSVRRVMRRLDSDELRELVSRVADELPELREARPSLAALTTPQSKNGGPKRDRAAYMREYRARQRV